MVNGLRCRVVKVIDRTSEISLFAAHDLRGLVVQGVIRSGCCETFNPSGLAFELQNIKLGSDPSLFDPPVGYTKVEAIEFELQTESATLDTVEDFGAGESEANPASKNGPPVCDSMSVSPERVRVGEPVVIEVRVSDPDRDFLTYDWKATPGTIIEAGAGNDGRVTLDTTGLPPGRHRITIVASDGFGHATECSTGFEVMPR
jgi:hypothetical protein